MLLIPIDLVRVEDPDPDSILQAIPDPIPKEGQKRQRQYVGIHRYITGLKPDLLCVYKVFLSKYVVLIINNEFATSQEWMRSSQVWMRSSQVWIRSSQEWMRSSPERMRSSPERMRSSQEWMRSSQVWMRPSQVVRASGCQCQSRNSPVFDPSLSRHSGI
jgi:hypothetical protein